MVKAIYERKQLIGSFITVSEGYHEREHGRRLSGRHRARTIANSLYLILKQKA